MDAAPPWWRQVPLNSYFNLHADFRTQCPVQNVIDSHLKMIWSHTYTATLKDCQQIQGKDQNLCYLCRQSPIELISLSFKKAAKTHNWATWSSMLLSQNHIHRPASHQHAKPVTEKVSDKRTTDENHRAAVFQEFSPFWKWQLIKTIKDISVDKIR